MHRSPSRRQPVVLRSLLALAVAVIAASGTAASAAATPVEIHADAGWIDTGFAVAPGATYTVTATGRAFTTMPDAASPYGYFHPNPGSGRAGGSGPGGQVYLCSSYFAGSCALEGAPFGALVGRVGDTSFLIGDASSFTVPAEAQAGTLQLAVNDFVQWYFDNSGSYLVSLE